MVRGMQSPTRRYAWYVLAVLSFINFMNYLDRQVMFALYPYVQDDLGLSDFQLGLLAPAFLIVHSVFSIPGGLLADRWFKRKVIAIGVSLWSLATMLGAAARGFADMFVYRALVGVGEAAYGPAANAMISDYFPLGQRGRAMGIFSVGMVIGGGVGMIAGTVIGDYFGWRYAFLVAGVPGFFLAAMAWRLREVRRERAQEPAAPGHVLPRGGVSWRRLWRTATVRYTFAGGICITFCIGGLIAWMVSFLDRYYVTQGAGGYSQAVSVSAVAAMPAATFPALAPAMSSAQAAAVTASAIRDAQTPRSERAKGQLAGLGVSFGIVALLAGLLGTVTGGYLADRLMRWRRSGRLLVSAAGFLLGTPFCVFGLYSDSATVFLVCLFLAIYFFVWYTGPIIAILHDVVAYRYRATIAAVYIFAIHLLGDAISPPIIGWISQRSELRHALLLPVGMALLGSIFLLLGTRTVRRDMEAAAREGAADVLAAAQ
jgi:MFS family permease